MRDVEENVSSTHSQSNIKKLLHKNSGYAPRGTYHHLKKGGRGYTPILFFESNKVTYKLSFWKLYCKGELYRFSYWLDPLEHRLSDILLLLYKNFT